jgi:hypothetical protein
MVPVGIGVPNVDDGVGIGVSNPAGGVGIPRPGGNCVSEVGDGVSIGISIDIDQSVGVGVWGP